MTTFGPPECRTALCKADPPELHGPYTYWTRKHRGRTVARLLNPEQSERYRPWLENARKLRALVKELEALSIDTAEHAEGEPQVGQDALPAHALVGLRFTSLDGMYFSRFGSGAVNARRQALRVRVSWLLSSSPPGGGPVRRSRSTRPLEFLLAIGVFTNAVAIVLVPVALIVYGVFEVVGRDPYLGLESLAAGVAALVVTVGLVRLAAARRRARGASRSAGSPP